jgi:hypothetical protein
MDTVKSIPDEIAPIYNVIHNQLTWAYSLWNELKYLFSEQIRLDLINHSAPTYFFNMQQATLIEIQLIICRLSDEASFGKKANVSFPRLSEMIHSLDKDDIANKMQEELNKANDEIGEVRGRRNKLIGHLDYQALIVDEISPIPELTETQINNSLSAFSRSFNVVAGHFLDTGIGFEHTIVEKGIAGVLYLLQEGVRYRELVDEDKIPMSDMLKGKYYGA